MLRTLAVGCLAVCPASALAAQAVEQMKAPNTTIRGRAVDEQGAPIVGAGVAVGQRSALDTAQVIAGAEQRTGEDGRFEVVMARANATAVLLIAAKGRVAAIARPGPAQLFQFLNVGYLPPTPAEDVLDLGDIVLARGVTLRGRVSGANGKPLPGARIDAADAMAGASVAYPQIAGRFASFATSDANGVFALGGVFPEALALTFSAEGHYSRTIRPVSRLTPLSVELTPSGHVAGRVVGADGRPVAARVFYRSERGTPITVATAADGSFRTTLAHAGRYRLSAIAEGYPRAESSVFSGPKADLVLKLVRADAGKALIVRAVDGVSGEALVAFEGSVRWLPANQLQFAAMQFASVAGTKAGADGRCVLAPPAGNEPSTGAVHVSAKGYAATTKIDLAFGEDSREVTVKLAREVVITGIVKNATGAAPVAGARVAATPDLKTDGGNPLLMIAQSRAVPGIGGNIKTDEDGRFRVTGLPAGKYTIQITVPNRPPVPAQTVETELGEPTAALTFLAPAGVAFRGELTGATLTPGSVLHLIPQQRGGVAAAGAAGIFLARTTVSGAMSASTRVIRVAADGSFAAEGLAAGKYAISLSTRANRRAPQPISVPLGSLEVGAEALTRDFDMRGKMPVEVRGRVSFRAGASVATDRLTVALQRQQANNPFFMPSAALSSSIVAPVEPSGSYKLLALPGKYRVQLFDLATGLNLASHEETLEIDKAAPVEFDLQAEVVEVKVKLESAEEGVAPPMSANRLEIRSLTAVDPRYATIFSNLRFDTQIGVPLEAGQREVSFVAPPGEYDAVLRTQVHNLWPAGMSIQMQHVGHLRFDVEAGKPIEQTIKFSAPPKVPGG